MSVYLAALLLVASCLQPTAAAILGAGPLPHAMDTATGSVGEAPADGTCHGMVEGVSDLCEWVCVGGDEALTATPSSPSKTTAAVSGSDPVPALAGAVAARAPPYVAPASGRDTYLLTRRLRL